MYNYAIIKRFGVIFIVLICSILIAGENGEEDFTKIWSSTSPDMPAAVWDALNLGDIDQDGMQEFLVCTDENGATMYIFETSGSNSFNQVWSYNITNCTYSYTLTTGDLNSNGIPELIAGVKAGRGSGYAGVHIFEWDGVSGSDNYIFQTSYDVDGNGGSMSSIGAGDFDNDGVVELFLGETEDDDLYIVSLDQVTDYNSPNWNIEFHDVLDNGIDYSPWGFTYGDFDNDGKIEMATIEADYNGLIVIEANGTDSYQRELWWDDMTYPDDGYTLRSLLSHDFNNDGLIELILPSTNGNVYIIQNFGTFVDLNAESSALGTVLSLAGLKGASLGDQDMFVGNINEPNIYIAAVNTIYDLEYKGGDFFNSSNWEIILFEEDVTITWQQTITGDYDNDGYKEIVAVNKNGPAFVDVYEKTPPTPAEFTLSAAFDSSDYMCQIRSVEAGSDLDQDGKKEFFITDYRNGGQIHGFEAVGNDQYEWIWSSDLIESISYANRNVVTGDLDNDGLGEVIFALNADAGCTDYGLQIYEWDGITDNGFNNYVQIPIDNNLLTDRYRFEQLAPPADIDGDGQTEILLANNGNDGVLGDKFYVFSVDGDFESDTCTYNIEASWNKGEDVFNGAPYYGDYGDLDGDGTYEIVFVVWDHGGLFIVDVTGPDTYEYINYIQTDIYQVDGFGYAGVAIADFDGDDRDEVMVPMYTGISGTDRYTMILNIDGAIADATVENSVGEVRGPYLGAALCSPTTADLDGDGIWEFYCSNYESHVYQFLFTGGDVMSSDAWEVTAVAEIKANPYAFGNFALDIAPDMDGDGKYELVVGYLESWLREEQHWLEIYEYNYAAPGPDISLSIPDIEAGPGAAVAVPVVVDSGFANVAMIELHISYDENLLTFDGISSDYLSADDANSNEGQVNVIWVYSGTAMDVPDGSTLLKLNFTVAVDASAGTWCALDFIGSNNVAAPDESLFYVEYNDGSFTVQSTVTNSISLEKGWNWLSYNVSPDDKVLTTILSLLDTLGAFIKSQDAFSTWYAGSGWYSGNGLEALYPEQMYNLQMKADTVLEIDGLALDPAQTPISVQNGWNWVGYIPDNCQNLDNALQSLEDKAVFIKSQDAFAYYYEDYGWYGSLAMMEPMEGYKLLMSTDSTLLYSAGTSKDIPATEKAPIVVKGWEVHPAEYAANMAITLALQCNDKRIDNENFVIGAFAGDECRGLAAVDHFPLTGEAIYSLLIYGEADEELSLRVYDQTNREETVLNATVTFLVDGMQGTADEPVMIGVNTTGLMGEAMIPDRYELRQNFPNPFNPTTYIAYTLPEADDVTISIFDLQGRLVSTLVNSRQEAGEYNLEWTARSANGRLLSTGIYLVSMDTDKYHHACKMVLMK